TRASHSEGASMTDDTIHTCSYSCERPGCIRAQRDELVAKVEALRAEVAEWKRVAAAQAGLHDEAEARAKRLEKRLSAYQAAVNKIDDLIEYSLPMPSGTKAALYAVLANLTATIAVELTND